MNKPNWIRKSKLAYARTLKKLKWRLKIIRGKELIFNRQIKCKKIFLGTEYGGYFIYPENISKDSVVYSFGIGEDISFDLDIIKRFGCEVHAFDPTPDSINWLKKQALPENFHYYNFGLANSDRIAKFFPPDKEIMVSHTILKDIYKEVPERKAFDVELRKLKTILEFLNHNKIEILKLDIEGAEYEVIEDILTDDIEIKQILVEFHHRFFDDGEIKTKEIIAKLNEKGYKIFAFTAVEPNYSFIKENRQC